MVEVKHNICVLNRALLDRLLASEAGPIASQLLKAAKRAERQAKLICPVDTGRLRSSITSGLRQEGKQICGILGTNVEYAPYVELGTRFMAARPFLIPAVYATLQGTGIGAIAYG